MINWLNIFRRKSNDQRGEYFDIKNYTQADQPLPNFEDIRDKLPAPILKDNPEWIKMYWKCWKLAFAHFRKVKPNSGFVADYIDEAFSDNIFQWDTIFMLMFARYGNHIFPSIRSLDNFYARQHKSGYICRETSEINGEDFVFLGRKHTVNPPLFSWVEMENFKLTGDLSRLKLILLPLIEYANWLEQKSDFITANGKKWESYGRRSNQSKHNLYWNTGLGSGMDNLPRNGNGSVDMSSQIVIQYNYLAKICQKLGLTKSKKIYQNRAKVIAAQINQWCWNEVDGFYYDVDNNGRQIKHKTVSTFWPLLAGIADKVQVQKLVAHLKDPKTFWRPFIFPSLAADQKSYAQNGDYWRGGVWAPTNYMIIKGLENYGYYNFAKIATEKYLSGLAEVFKSTNTLWENYAPESFTPGNPAKKDFVGWSGCGPIALLIENVLGFECDANNKHLTWRIKRKDRHGIKNLHFGSICVSAIYEPTNEKGKIITITTNQSIELILIHKGKKQKYMIKQGTQNLFLN